MAINDSAAQAQAAAAAATVSQRAQASQTGQPQQQGGGAPQKLNLRSMGNVSRIPMSRNANSEIIAKLQEAIAKQYDQDSLKSMFEIRLIALDNNTYRQLRFSTLLVAVRNKLSTAKSAVGVAYYALLVQATGVDLNPITENVQGRPTEVLRTPDFAWDADLSNIVNQAMREAYPNENLLPCDGTVLGRHTFDHTNESMVYLVARNALAACSTTIDQAATDFRDFTLADASFTNTALVIRTERETLMDDAGNPMRSDIQMELRDNQKQTNGTDYRPNNNEDTGRLGYCSAFVDVGWAPLAPQQGMFMGQQVGGMPTMPGAAAPTQTFAANLVITHVENDELITLPAVLLNIAMTVAIAEGWGWLYSFVNTGGKRRQHDIGTLNYEANLFRDPSGIGQPVPTATDDFQLEQLFQFAQMVIQPGLAISVDVPDCGPQTHYLGILAAAAEGNVEAKMAIDAAWNWLTDGQYNMNLPTNEPLFINQGNRIHLGYRIDESGMKTDIRDLDYISMATLKGGHDLDMVRKWSDTFSATSVPLPVRLEMRARLIKEVYPSAVFTGMATRVTFGPKRLAHAVQAIMTKGLRPVIQTSGFGLTSTSQRGYASFAQGGLYMPGQVTYGQGHQQQNGSYFSHNLQGFHQRYR
jgi:hypothetical protein